MSTQTDIEIIAGRLAILESQLANIEEAVRRRGIHYQQVSSGLALLMPTSKLYAALKESAAQVEGLLAREIPDEDAQRQETLEHLEDVRDALRQEVKKVQNERIAEKKRVLALRALERKEQEELNRTAVASSAVSDVVDSGSVTKRDADLAI